MSDQLSVFITSILMAAILIGLGLVLGIEVERKSWHKKAIEARVAERYMPTRSSTKTEFRFITNNVPRNLSTE